MCILCLWFHIYLIQLVMPYYNLFFQEQPGELSSKSTSSDTFDEIHQVVLERIGDNMASLAESGKYGTINTIYTSTNGFYVIMFTSGA